MAAADHDLFSLHFVVSILDSVNQPKTRRSPLSLSCAISCPLRHTLFILYFDFIHSLVQLLYSSHTLLGFVLPPFCLCLRLPPSPVKPRETADALWTRTIYPHPSVEGQIQVRYLFSAIVVPTIEIERLKWRNFEKIICANCIVEMFIAGTQRIDLDPFQPTLSQGAKGRWSTDAPGQASPRIQS